MQEIVTTCTLQPVANMVSDPDYINQFPATLIDDAMLDFEAILDVIKCVRFSVSCVRVPVYLLVFVSVSLGIRVSVCLLVSVCLRPSVCKRKDRHRIDT